MERSNLDRELGEISERLAYVGNAMEDAANHRQETTDRIARIETRLDVLTDTMQTARQNEVEVKRILARDTQGDEDRAEMRARYALWVSLIALITSAISAIAPHL